jgi:AbrB family looped-hinge helix DNA binding protein
MATIETVSVGQGGDVPIPQSIRELTGIEAGTRVQLEVSDDVIVIRPVREDVELYSSERKAEFLLSNAVDANDYANACEVVRKLGLDPNQVAHHRPPGV